MPRGVGAATVLLLILVVVALSIASARLDSATWDEPSHIVNGMVRIQERWPAFFREQPPLMNTLTAAPLAVAGYRVEPGWKTSNYWAAGRHFLYRSGYSANRILFLARLPTIALFAALCLVVYWFVARGTGSAGWALVATALTGFCPNLMAHGRLATVDLAVTFFAFTSTALLLTLIDGPSWPLGILFGLTTAAAVMAKVSGLILPPYFVAVIVAALVMRRIAQPGRFFAVLAAGAVAGLVFFEAFTLAEASDAYVRETYPALQGPVARLAVPFVEYATNIRAIQGWYEHGLGLPQFFLGRFSEHSWPSYYPVAFLLKTTIPAMLLLVLATVLGFTSGAARFTWITLFGFAAVFFAIATTSHLALGVRYVLPVYPFLYAGIPFALQAKRAPNGFILVVAMLVVWHAGENLANYPGYISYFNELIGPRRNADKFLVDSNLDWGQDLRRLHFWCVDHGVSQIAIHYFGGGDVGFGLSPARVMVLNRPPTFPLPNGYFALSRHYYRMSFFRPLWGIDYDTLLAAQHARYVTTIGGSIYLYRVER